LGDKPSPESLAEKLYHAPPNNESVGFHTRVVMLRGHDGPQNVLRLFGVSHDYRIIELDNRRLSQEQDAKAGTWMQRGLANMPSRGGHHGFAIYDWKKR